MYDHIDCLSCGQPLGHLWSIYKELIQKYSKIDDPQGLSAEYRSMQELAEKHGFDPETYCCRRMLECNYDATDIIN